MPRYTVSITIEADDIAEVINTAANALNDGAEPDFIQRVYDDNGYNMEDVTCEVLEAERNKHGN